MGAGATSLQIDAAADVTRLTVDVDGSAASGSFASATGITVERDDDAAVPFTVAIPFSRPFPGDGSLHVTVTPLDARGEAGAAETMTFAASETKLSFSATPITIHATETGLVLDVGHGAGASTVTARVVGVNAEALRSVSGSLDRAASIAFAFTPESRARVALGAASTSVVVPFISGRRPGADAVVVVDVALIDAFGRVIHSSVIESLGQESDELLSLTAGPSPLLLSEGFGQRVRLTVRGAFLLGGDVDLSGAGTGVRYTSSEPSVAFVTTAGEVVARDNGTATVTVHFGATTASVDVIVDGTATLESVSIAPAAPVIARIGGSVDLRLEGELTDGRIVDLTSAGLGTLWTSAAPTIVRVDGAGRATSLRAGMVAITASHAGFVSQPRDVDAQDGPPTVAMVAPASVLQASSFEVRAEVDDDVRVASVDFLVGGVPVSRLSAPPWVLSLQAPPSSARMFVAAIAHDSAGQTTRSAEVAIDVTGAVVAGPPVVLEAPPPGAVLVAGHAVRLAALSPGAADVIFRSVAFFVDGALVGVSQSPRIDMRGTAAEPEQVPLWEIGWVPAVVTASGRASVLRVEATDRNGALSSSDAVLVRIAADAPPLLSLTSPSSAAVSATPGSSLAIAGSISDDTLALGAQLLVTVNGLVALERSVSAPPSGATSASPLSGTAAFSSAVTLPSSGTRANVRVSVIDARGQETTRSLVVAFVEDRAPQLAILSPSAGQSVPAGSTLLLTAAAVGEGTVSVRWLADEVAVGAGAGESYAVSLAVPSTSAGTTMNVSAIARDSSGQETRQDVAVAIVADTTRPGVSLVVPRDGGQHVVGRDLLVSVAAVDASGLARIEVLIDDVVVGVEDAPARSGSTSTAHVVVSAAQLGAPGTRIVSARAADLAGNVGFSPRHAITLVDDQVPEIAFVAPAPGARVAAGASVAVVVEATDDLGVTEVELFVDGQSAGTQTVPPYRFVVTLAGPPRSALLRATARDAAAHVVQDALGLEVDADDSAPLVAFRAPLPAQRVFAGRDLTVQVGANDDVGVQSFALLLDTASAGPPLSRTRDGLFDVATWHIPGGSLAAGTSRTLQAIVTDAAGNAGRRTLTFAVVTDAFPVVTLLSPAPGTPVLEGDDVTVTYLVSDDEGVIGTAGRSGGALTGPLPTPPAPILPRAETSGTRTVLVRAPILGLPATVGAAAQDTTGQTTTADVAVDVRSDDEAPVARLTAPIPGPAPFVVDEGRGFGLRVDGSDNVRITSVAVFVDDVEVAGAPVPVLQRTGEQLEETRVDNPLAPGSVLVSRRRVSSFAGTLSVASLSLGLHHVRAKARDAAGNETATAELTIEVKPFVDTSAPTLSLIIGGAPGQCVAGASISVRVQATDDVNVETFALKLDGVNVALPPPSAPLPTLRINVATSVVVPQTLGRTLAFSASATDAAGLVGTAGKTCLIVADAAPTVALRSPPSGGVLLEGRAEHVSATVTDDVGAVRAWAVLSSEAAAFDAGGIEVASMAPPARVEIDVGGLGFVETGASLHVSPWESATAGRLLLDVGTVPNDLVAVFDADVAPGHEDDAALLAFFARAPDGVLSEPDASGAVDLSFPEHLLVRSIDVSLCGMDCGLAIERLRFDVENGAVTTLLAATMDAAVQVRPASVDSVDTQAGVAAVVDVSLRPAPGAFDFAIVAMAAFDEGDRLGVDERPVIVDADQTPPLVSVQSPADGTHVVEGSPFTVTVQVSDDVEVDAIELFVDDAPGPVLVRSGPTWTATVVLPARGERTVSLSLGVRHRSRRQCRHIRAAHHPRRPRAPAKHSLARAALDRRELHRSGARERLRRSPAG